MFIENWEAFYQQSEQLCLQNPTKCRYVCKYRHCDKALIVKVTDDKTCLQYKTDQQADLKRIEKLNSLFFSVAATGGLPAGDVEMKPVEAAAQSTVTRAKKQRRKG